jgi:protein phosphatase
MGGHSAGEVASTIAVDTISQELPWGSDDPATALLDVVRAANRRIFDTAATAEKLSGMGTTCTAVVLTDWKAYLAHVGDSRLYLVRAGEIYSMTEDDSSVMEMVRQGILTREEARSHADRNVILRALGTHPAVEVSSWARPFPVRDGDRFILSTDGLHDLVEDTEIRDAVLTRGRQQACAGLIAAARERGGPDNITVVLLEVSSGERPADEPKSTRILEEPSP